MCIDYAKDGRFYIISFVEFQYLNTSIVKYL